MKLRTGFVSNSSSTSFSIYGTFLSNEKFNELVERLSPNQKHPPKRDAADIVAKHILGLSGEAYSSEDGVYIGRRTDSIQDSETGQEFKTNVCNIFKNNHLPPPEYLYGEVYD